MRSRTGLVWGTALVIALAAAPASAKKRTDAITARGPGGGPAASSQVLDMSGPIEGVLEDGDPALGSGELYDLLPFDGRRGQHVVLRMVSEQFDAYLVLVAPSGQQVDDDDGGKGTNARIEADLTEDGAYRVVLTSKTPGERGSYVLHLRSDGGRFGTLTGAGPNMMPAPGITSTVGEGAPQVSAGVRPLSQGTLRIRPGQGVISLGPEEVPEAPYDGPVNPINPEVPTGQTVTSGQTITGALGPGDRSLGGGQWADWYEFEARAGQEVRVDLSSRSLDAFVAVVPPGGEPLTNDDRAQGNTDSFLSFPAPTSGTYLVAASSYQRGERGDYALRLTVGGGAAPGPGPVVGPGESSRGSLAAGDDQLSTGEFIDWYPLNAQAGEEATIALTSTEFDAYLVLLSPSGEQFDNDDAGEGTHDARIVRRIDEAGAWQIGVTSYQPGERGAYELEVATAAGTPGPDPGPSPRPGPAPASSGTLTAGRSTSGELAPGDTTLASGEFVDSYSFEGQAGQTVRVDMISTAIDPYVILQTPGGRQAENDDVAPNDRNASVSMTLPETGTYSVLCTSYQPREAGSYDVALVVGDAAEPPPGPGPTWGGVPSQDREFFGVFVGISDYPGSGNDLPLCREDAEKLAQTFKGIGLMDDSHIDLITDSRATEANVRSAMRRMAGRVGPDDVFVFFYSGHGGQSDPDPERHDDEVDGREESIILNNDEYTDDEMSDDLDGIRAGLTVVALDSCFAGGFARDIISEPGRVGLFSSEEDLTSNVAQEFEAGGYLSHFFQKAVEGYADTDGDGLVQIGELSHYLQTQYAEYVREASSESSEGAAGYQHLVVDRGAVRVDTLFFRAGRTVGGSAPRTVNIRFQ
ncbi:MAG: pre-peptidase C-terminal domain-containing protein [Deltaproteobacteria bacterium]|nr:pre-peptidase C-terminal domain-containing protein [Deltaproteobacteria bacterium]